MRWRKFINYSLVIMLFWGGIFNYPTTALFTEEIFIGNQKISSRSQSIVLVEIYHYDKKTGKEIYEKEIRNEAVGTVLIGEDFVKDIQEYKFYKSTPKVLEVTKDNNVIELYYKEKEDKSLENS